MAVKGVVKGILSILGGLRGWRVFMFTGLPVLGSPMGVAGLCRTFQTALCVRSAAVCLA